MLASCTALACMQVFKEINYDLQGKQVCIIGSTIVLGKPLAGMLNQLHATVSLLNSFTPNLSTYTKFADVIVSATGIKHLLSKEMVKKDVVLIDVGSNKDENNVTHGDFDPVEFTDIASVISPSPGGIGPITISMLMHNVIKAYVHHLARTNNKGD
ncbi:bifunctional 5,10-methylenetetrahydrofolate dehydrogenase/5,10-methenyltetrahydrofolate cyclohydrolase [bacterium]|nr:bifunctional 5,10-methylenetetrahydrofolate dehydrogenase/5,10-methenyltetrahydrofolate cyclohydrolase [bacterium]